MAVLRHMASGRQVQLQPRHLVGRSSECLLRLDSPTVSGEHATVFWSGEGWRVRDLGSRNGTWVGDERLAPGVARALGLDVAVAFGEAGDRCIRMTSSFKAVGKMGLIVRTR